MPCIFDQCPSLPGLILVCTLHLVFQVEELDPASINAWQLSVCMDLHAGTAGKAHSMVVSQSSLAEEIMSITSCLSSRQIGHDSPMLYSHCTCHSISLHANPSMLVPMFNLPPQSLCKHLLRPTVLCMARHHGTANCQSQRRWDNLGS